MLHVLEATRGGTRTHVLDLLPALAARGWTCGLAYSSTRNPDFSNDARRLEALGIPCWDIAMKRGPHAGDARAVRKLTLVARSFGPSLIHAHSSKAGLLARLAAPFVPAPVVYTPHCVAFDTSLPRLHKRLARWGEIALAAGTARFIAVSRSEARALSRVLPVPSERITLIPNGLDLSGFPLSEGSTSRTAFTIGCFGRLSAQKNQAVLLRALKLLRHDGLEARLLLVGGGEDEALLRGLARELRLEASVEWAGEVGDARPLYARCDVVALPSRWEGCPYSLVEAMAARRAVVAADIAPLREILISRSEPAGLLCRAHSAEMAGALSSLAQDAARREQLGQAARARIESGFTLARMADETARVYEEVSASST